MSHVFNLFHIYRWLDVGQDDKKIQRELVPTKPGKGNHDIHTKNYKLFDWAKTTTYSIWMQMVRVDPKRCMAFWKAAYLSLKAQCEETW